MAIIDKAGDLLNEVLKKPQKTYGCFNHSNKSLQWEKLWITSPQSPKQQEKLHWTFQSLKERIKEAKFVDLPMVWPDYFHSTVIQLF